MGSSLPHTTNSTMCLYISPYVLLLSISSLFQVRVRDCCQYRENQHNCPALHVTFNENEVRSNLHGRCYFITARAAEAGCYSASQVCKTESRWQRGCLAQESWHPPCLPAHLLCEVKWQFCSSFQFPLFLFFLVTPSTTALGVVKEVGGRRPTQPPAKGSPHQTTSSSGRPSWTQIHKVPPKNSITRENWLLSCTRSTTREIHEYFLWIVCWKNMVFLSQALKILKRAEFCSFSFHFPKAFHQNWQEGKMLIFTNFYLVYPY